MWNPLDLLKTPARKEEERKTAEQSINTHCTAFSRAFATSETQKDPQSFYLQVHGASIFAAYQTIAAHDPLRAIKVLLEIEKAAKPTAQAAFWKEADEQIRKALKNASAENKESVYRNILDHAHKGQLADFLIAHADNITPILLAPKSPTNAAFITSFLAHASPKTRAFLTAFESQLTAVYTQGLMDRPTLIKNILKACYPINEKGTVTPPAYVVQMKDEQIKELVKRIVQLHMSGDSGFKKITNCLQELETLKSCSCEALKRIKGERPTKIERSIKADKSEKDDFYLYLYQLPTEGVTSQNPDSKLPKHIYILATKPKGFGTPEDSGKVTAILASSDLDRVTDAFAIMPFDKGFQRVLAKMAEQLVPPVLKPLTKQFATPHYTYAPTTYLIDTAALVPSFKLTAAADSLNLRHEQASVTPINWDSLSLQQYPARAV